jgi:hypothetical protein
VFFAGNFLQVGIADMVLCFEQKLLYFQILQGSMFSLEAEILSVNAAV